MQDLGREFNLMESVFGTQRGSMGYLRDMAFMLNEDGYKKLIASVANLTGKQSIAVGATKGLGAAMELKGTKAKIAAGGMAMLTGAMKLIPFVGIIALVGSLASGLLRIASNADSGTRSLREIRGSLNESRQAHEDNIRSIEHNERANRILIDRLSELQGETSLNAGEQQELAAIADRLSDRIDGVSLTVDSSTGKLDENSEAVLRSIERHNDFARAMDHIASYQDLWFEMADAYAELEMEIARVNAELENFEGTGEAASAQFDQMTVEVEGLRQEQANLREEMDEVTDRIEANAERQAEAFRELAYNNEVTFDHLNEAQRGLVNDLVDRWELYQSRSTEMFSRHNQDAEVWGSYTNEAGERVQGVFAITEENQDEALQAMIDNMQANREATQEWSNNLDHIAEEFCADFAEHLRQLGPDAAGHVQAMVHGCSELMEELVNEFHQGGTMASEQIGNSLGDGQQYIMPIVEDMVNADPLMDRINREFPQVGEAIPQGIATGANAASSQAIDSITQMSMECIEAARDAFSCASPSRVFKEIGGDVVAGLAIGISDNQDQPTTALETLATAMERVYNRSGQTYQNIGRDIINGLNQGLLNRENTVMSTVRRIANNITREMQRALDINSPSRVMREGIGRFIPEGVAAGIDKYAGAAIDSVHKLGNDLINVNIPSVESMIGMGPSMRYAGAGLGGNVNNDNKRIINNQGLFEGATINWHGEEDIRRTMEKMAWIADEDSARMW